MYFLIEAEHSDGTVYPLGVCAQAHSENDVHPDLELHSRPLPKGTEISCGLMYPESIRERMFDLLECLSLREKAKEFTYYTLRAGSRAVALFAAPTPDDAEDIASRVNTLLPDDVRVTPHFFSVGPADDFPSAFGASPASLAIHVQEVLSGKG